MTPSTHRSENVRTLAAALGLDDELAAPLLDQPIRITWDASVPGAVLLGREVVRLLEKTFSTVIGPDAAPGQCQAELVINGAIPKGTSGPRAFCWIDELCLQIGDDTARREVPTTFPHPLLSLVSACFAAAWTARTALAANLGGLEPSPISLDFTTFAPNPRLLTRRVEIDTCHLAGAGAIGTCFVYALRLLEVSGALCIIDPKPVTDGILNRCAWFETEDLKSNKAEILVHRAQPALPNVRLTSYAGTVADYQRDHHIEIARLIVGVDSRRARRSLQADMPGEVFDSSTTGIEEIVFHHNLQLTEGACLACIYPHTTNESTHDHHVADLLNISALEIATGFVSESAATRILTRYPNLAREDVLGRAYDSLYKALCATAQLRRNDEQQVLAPFGFVSMLAGAILTLELVNRSYADQVRPFNYWRISPWTSPNVDLQLVRGREPTCEVCSKPDYQSIASDLWQDLPTNVS